MKKRPLLLGHRGARATRRVPENSIASFELTMKHGCDGFEFDVRRSGDGAAVICHDPVWRASGSGRPGVEVAGAAIAELNGIAQLKEVVEQFGRTAYLDIELKIAGLGAHAVEAIKKHRPERYVVSSFQPAALEEVRAMAPEIPLGLICDTQSQLETWKALPLTAVIPQHKLVTRELVHELKAADKKVLVWTVNDESKMRELGEWGVDGIISDETELLVKTFA